MHCCQSLLQWPASVLPYLPYFWLVAVKRVSLPVLDDVQGSLTAAWIASANSAILAVGQRMDLCDPLLL